MLGRAVRRWSSPSQNPLLPGIRPRFVHTLFIAVSIRPYIRWASPRRRRLARRKTPDRQGQHTSRTPYKNITGPDRDRIGAHKIEPVPQRSPVRAPRNERAKCTLPRAQGRSPQPIRIPESAPARAHVRLEKPFVPVLVVQPAAKIADGIRFVPVRDIECRVPTQFPVVEEAPR